MTHQRPPPPQGRINPTVLIAVCAIILMCWYLAVLVSRLI